METNHETFFKEAALVAHNALCLRDKCGSVIVKNNVIIGSGYNAPPCDEIAMRKCNLDLQDSSKIKSDRTCCVHAEWNAIISALKSEKDLSGSILYFTRVDEAGNILQSGKPYCTVCSRLALQSGIAQFALWHDKGIRLYDTHEYNELSYAFHLNK